jgi:uncharacterized repeat protein (TIGR03803 family)
MNKLYSSISRRLIFIISLTVSLSATASPTSFISKPADQSADVNAPTLKITANVVEGANTYTIELCTNADFSGEILTKTSEVENQRTLIFTGLKYSTTYYARAKTNTTSYGKVTHFTTRAEIFPVIIEPAGGTSDANPVVMRVVISRITDASTYTVEVNAKADFSSGSVVQISSIKDQTSFIFKNLKYSTTYFIRAKTDVSTKFGPVAKVVTRKRIAQRRLWGLTTAGGANKAGTIFSISVDSLTLLRHHDYIESSEYPNAYLDGTLTHAPDGGFYGSSECDRNGTCGNGEIFHVSNLGEYQVVAHPYIHAGSVMLASNDRLYVIDDWINYFQGGIIRMPSQSSEFELSEIIFRIKSKTQGLNPHATLIEGGDGYLYGLAPLGGESNQGVIFKIKYDGTDFNVIHHFNASTSGTHPQGDLMLGTDGYLYGTTQSGGSGGQGTVFKISKDGSDVNTLVGFAGYNGATPLGTLAQKNNRIYGMTSVGGDFGKGTLFSVAIDGTLYKKLLSFNGANGASPQNTPTIVDNYVFGMTTRGGLTDQGVVFRINADGSSYRKLYDFTEQSGTNPTGALLLAEDFFPAKTALPLSEDRMNVTPSVNIFPNPFVSNATAEISSDHQNAIRVVITDLNGFIVSQSERTTNTQFSIGDNLQKGIYILKVTNGQTVQTQRIVKQ